MPKFGRETTTQTVVPPRPSRVATPNVQPISATGQHTWLITIPLSLMVIVAFIPIINNGFVSWDDGFNFLENRYFRGIGPDQVKWAWSTFRLGVYQPLAWMLFEAQYVCCRLEPRGYHLTSLILQVANAVVLYFLTLALLDRNRANFGPESPWIRPLSAGIATALFVVHPLRVEAVAWASCQPYLPCILFSMLAVLAYLRAIRGDSSLRIGWLFCSLALFVAALLFKAVAVSLPVVLLILDVYPLRRIPDTNGRWFGPTSQRVLLEKVPFALASLFAMWLALTARVQSPAVANQFDASKALARACYGIWFYVVKTVLPRDLIAVYPIPVDVDWLAPLFLSSIVATLALTAALFLRRRRWPGLFAAWLSYLVILAPNLGIIRISEQIAADRYSYMAMLGAVVLAASGFCGIWRTCARLRPQTALGLLVIGLGTVLALLVMTRNQCRTWLDSETLWNHALAHGAKSSALVHNNLGSVFFGEEQYDRAEAEFAEAVRLDPNYADAHNNLGAVLQKKGSYQAAEDHFTQALGLDAGLVQAHLRLGLLLAVQGKNEAAEAHLTEAVRLDPDYADGRNNLGTVLFRQKKYAEAEAHFAAAIRIEPSDVKARYNLGLLFADQRKYEAAEAQYAEALRIDPAYVNAHLNLGVVLSRQGKYEGAKTHYAEAIRLDPKNAEAYNNSAMLLAACPEVHFRDGQEAVKLATRACELTKWNNPNTLDTLAAAYAESGDFDAAVSMQTKALAKLKGGRQKDDLRSRLVLYQAKRPYRDVPPQRTPTEVPR